MNTPDDDVIDRSMPRLPETPLVERRVESRSVTSTVPTTLVAVRTKGDRATCVALSRSMMTSRRWSNEIKLVYWRRTPAVVVSVLESSVTLVRYTFEGVARNIPAPDSRCSLKPEPVADSVPLVIVIQSNRPPTVERLKNITT